MTRESRYPHVIRAVLETPWAILPETLVAIRDLIALRATGEMLSHEEIQARIGAGPARRDYQVVNGSVAVIPIYGVLTPKADLMSEMSGGTSVDRISAMFRDAIADDGVSAIVLDIDSPGGSTNMLPELAGEIRAARGAKPIVAQVNNRAASAGYWLAAQADEVVVPPSGDVGSVGVFYAHTDVSQMQANEGVKTTLIAAPADGFKTEGHPAAPLSEEARAAIQERVDEMYGMFVADLAKGRGVGVDTVRSDFGEGRMLSARKALDAGMVDRIDTIENTVRRVSRKRAQPAGQAAGAETTDSTFADDIDGALRACDTVIGNAEALRALTATKRDLLAQLGERLDALLAEPAPEPEPAASLYLEVEHADFLARRRLATANS